MSVPYWAVRGAKVVCVDAANNPGRKWYAGECPCVGVVYTISDAFVDPAGTACVRLEELPRTSEALADFGYDAGYALSRFRPVIDKDDETEARIFRAKHHTTPAIPEGV